MDWQLILDVDLKYGDWLYSSPNQFNYFRIEQKNPPKIGQFSIAQAVEEAENKEFLEVKTVAAQSEIIRIQLNPFPNIPRLIGLKLRYLEADNPDFPWHVRIWGTVVDSLSSQGSRGFSTCLSYLRNVSSQPSLALSANPNRSYALLSNRSPVDVFISFGSLEAANSQTGILIQAYGGAFEINQSNLYLGEICAFSNQPTSLIVWECV